MSNGNLGDALAKAGLTAKSRPKRTQTAPGPEAPKAQGNGQDLMEGIDPSRSRQNRYAPSTGRLGSLAQALKSAAVAVDPDSVEEHPVILDVRPGVVIVAIPLQYPAPSKDATALFLTQGGRSHACKDADGVVHQDVKFKPTLMLGTPRRQAREEE